MKYLIVVCIAGLVCGGCAATSEQVAQPPTKIVQSPENGLRELDIVARAFPPVGKVLPVQIAITSLTTKSLTLDAQGIRAEQASGPGAAVLSVADADRAAGGADQLNRALTEKENTGPWEFCGLAYLAARAVSPDLQTKHLSLQNGSLEPGVEQWGYIFLPSGSYTAIEVPVSSDTGAREVAAQRWDSAADLAGGSPGKPTSTPSSLLGHPVLGAAALTASAPLCAAEIGAVTAAALLVIYADLTAGGR
jgi:hypothetical protein